MSRTIFLTRRTALHFLPLLFIAGLCLNGAAQDQSNRDKLNVATPSGDASARPAETEKAEGILQHAVAAQGGQAYLSIRSLTGRGIFTPFTKGASQSPTSFVDYTVFPDRERTEFRGQGNRVVQANVGKQGWVYDNAARTIKDMQPAQVEDFQLALRTSLDNLLRGWWRKEGAMLAYVGRREAGLARRNETVRLTYPDGFYVEFEFGAKDGLPAKTIYKRRNAEGEEVVEEDRYARYLTINGVTLPYVIDHYRAGDQSSRINYDMIEVNRSIPDSFFDKPANFKAVK